MDISSKRCSIAEKHRNTIYILNIIPLYKAVDLSDHIVINDIEPLLSLFRSDERLEVEYGSLYFTIVNTEKSTRVPYPNLFVIANRVTDIEN